jgi:non-specific serine/threonine protein kinase
LELEHDNLRAALQWSLERGRTEENLRLAAKLAWYWYVRANLHEGRHWLEQALAASDTASTSSRAAAFAAAGTLAVQLGDRERAATFLEQAISLYCEPSCSNRAGWSMLNLGLLALHDGDYTRAGQLMNDSMALFRKLGDQAGVTTVLLHQGIAACHEGDPATATALLQQSLPSLRVLGDTVGVARAIHGLGVAARHQGDLSGAQKLLKEALQVAGEKGARLEISECMEGLAGVACDGGQFRLAAHLFGAAEALREAIGADRPFAIRADYARDVAATSAQLGEKAFASAWAEGRSARLAQATAYALAQADAGSEGKDAPGARRLTPLQAAKRQYDGLTARERQVAALVAQGKSNSAIASELVVAVRTVETHITHMLRKLGFSSRAQVAAWAVDKGLAPPPKTLQEKMDQGDLSPGPPASRSR